MLPTAAGSPLECTMTEADWLVSPAPDALLAFLEGRVSDRKFRLFACACCRRIHHLLTERSCRRAIDVAERFADGAASVEELNAAFTAAQHAKPLFTDANWAAAWTAAPNAVQAASETAAQAAQSVANIASKAVKDSAWAAVCAGAPEESRSAAWTRFESVSADARHADELEQAVLLREMVGNPFRPAGDAPSWSSTIVQLAEALYCGEDCAFAMHDALLEDGHTELAGHFQVARHPRGCWAVDRILGKS